jgi:uncharacterized protein
LSAAPEQHAPIFEKADDGTELAHPWCMGFLAAMWLRFEAWQPLCDLKAIELGLLLPVLLHCVDPPVGRCLDRRTRGRKPKRSSAPPTTTSHFGDQDVLDAGAVAGGESQA